MVTCDSVPPRGIDTGRFCDRRIDAQIARARALQSTDPYASNRFWSRIDREVTDEAPIVAYGRLPATSFVSRRVGDSPYSPVQLGPLYDQLWVK